MSETFDQMWRLAKQKWYIFLISTSKQHQYVSIDKVESQSLWKLKIGFGGKIYSSMGP